jgi:hypothetical protein
VDSPWETKGGKDDRIISPPGIAIEREIGLRWAAYVVGLGALPGIAFLLAILLWDIDGKFE